MKLFQCLYTHQKSKKRKKWQEGLCALHVGRRVALLYESRADLNAKRPLEECRHLAEQDLAALADGVETDFETDRHLVILEGCEEPSAAGRADPSSPPRQASGAEPGRGNKRPAAPTLPQPRRGGAEGPGGTKKQRKFKPPARKVAAAPPAASGDAAAAGAAAGSGAAAAGSAAAEGLVGASSEERELLEEQYRLWHELASLRPADS